MPHYLFLHPLKRRRACVPKSVPHPTYIGADLSRVTLSAVRLLVVYGGGGWGVALRWGGPGRGSGWTGAWGVWGGVVAYIGAACTQAPTRSPTRTSTPLPQAVGDTAFDANTWTFFMPHPHPNPHSHTPTHLHTPHPPRSQALGGTSFDANKRTFFTCEGLIYYIPAVSWFAWLRVLGK